MHSFDQLCFYHPTTVVIVDDNVEFLGALTENLSDTARYKSFNLPEKALRFLQGCKENLPAAENFLGVTCDLVTDQSLNVNIPRILARRTDEFRYDIPSVVIVDYDMPHMSGLQLCQELSRYPVKKIMLTGIADHKLAVQALNDRVIDKFILKDEQNLFETINKAVNALQKDYFAELSKPAATNIITTNHSFIGNAKFLHFFSKFLHECRAVEFYLTDTVGSFLIFNDKDEPVWLIVQSEEKINNYYKIAQDNDASTHIIQALDNKTHVLCLFSEEDFNQPIDKWDYYLHKANQLEGIEGFYYAVLSGKAAERMVQNIPHIVSDIA